MQLWLAGSFVASPRTHGELHEGVPAALYVVMDGHVLDLCADNAARGCTSLVQGPTQFPAFGTPQEQTAVRQSLEQLFADFDLVVTGEEPLPYVPYLLAVIGGTSSLIGHERTSCGIATLSCGADRRNLVSLTFAVSCGGPESTLGVAEVTAQEVAHNLGLEHTSSWTDVMFPTVNDNDKTFEDACNEILTPDYDDAWMCPDVHVLDCPEGDGGQQNGHAELLRVLGPRRVDTEPPQILDTVPADGDVLSPSDPIQIFASVGDDSGTVGLRWTWLEGPGIEDADVVTRCTNGVCDVGYEAWKPIDESWPFIEITDPAPGDYVFELEVADMYGNATAETIRVEVVDDAPGDGSLTDEGSESGSGAPEDADATGDGCGCRSLAAGPGMMWWTGLIVALRLRARRRACRTAAPRR